MSGGNSDSMSELERNYAARHGKSRLVVANADVAASSSESEHDTRHQGRDDVLERHEYDGWEHENDDSSSYRWPRAESAKKELRTPRPPMEGSYKPPVVQQQRYGTDVPYRQMDMERHGSGMGLGLQGLVQRRRDEDKDEGGLYGSGDQPYERSDLGRSGRERERRLSQERGYQNKGYDIAARVPTFAEQHHMDPEQEEEYYRLAHRQSSDSMTIRRRREQALIGLVDGLQLNTLSQPRPQKDFSPRQDDAREEHERHLDFANHYQEQDFTEVQVEEMSTGESDKNEDNNRKRNMTQPSRLPMGSRRHIDHLDEQRSAVRDHRRSTSLPPKSRPPSRADNPDVALYNACETEYKPGPTARASPEKIRHRRGSIMSQPLELQSSSRRRSMTDESQSTVSASRSNRRRRSSSYATETHLQPNRRRNSVQDSRILLQEKKSSAYDSERQQGRQHDLAHREREAFGIPASLSYVGYEVLTPELATERLRASEYHEDTPTVEREPRESAGHSTPERDRWDEANESGAGFSTGAQALLRRLEGQARGKERELGDGGGKEESRDSQRRMLNPRRMSGTLARARTKSSQYEQEREGMRKLERRLSGTISACSSAPSVYEEDSHVEEYPAGVQSCHAPQHPTAPSASSQAHTSTRQRSEERSWCATMHSDTYNSLLRTYGGEEMNRQELIYAYTCAHTMFIRRLRSLVRVFIVPLRRKHSKVWLPGVPKDVARLFDWLEDILNLHTSLGDTLQALTEPWKDGDAVLEFSRGLKGFVPRMEVYQPYIVRVDGVRATVARCVEDHEEFGEFVSLREGREECDGLGLPELFLLPVNHLHSAVETFKVRMIVSLVTPRHD
jgi:hypothetical protein